MAALTITYAHGCNGAIVGVGADGTYNHQFKPSAFSTSSRRPKQDTSGYGDAGFADFCVGIVYTDVTVTGWLLTTGGPGVDNLGSCDDTPISMTLTFDTGKTWAGNFVVDRMQIDHRYAQCVPILVAGSFKGAITETWA